MSQRNEESSFEDFQAERRRQLRLQRDREERELRYEIEGATRVAHQRFLARKQNADAGTVQSRPAEDEHSRPAEDGQNLPTEDKITEDEPSQQERKPNEHLANLNPQSGPNTQQEWDEYLRARAAMTPAEVEEEMRCQCVDHWRQESEGIDLVEMALEDPDAVQRSTGLSGTLLGREPWRKDEFRFAAKLLGYGEDFRYGERLVERHSHGSPDRAFISPEVCKFFICDRRVPKGEMTVDDLYAEQLCLEAENDPLERAREAVRTESDKILRHRARLFLAELEAAAERGEKAKPAEIWERLKPKRPRWIQALVETWTDFGFVFYKSKEARARPDALKRWMRIFNDMERTDNFGGYRTCFDGRKAVTDGFLLKHCIDAVWIEDELSEADPSSLRSYVIPYPISNVAAMILMFLLPGILRVVEKKFLPRSQVSCPIPL